MTVVGPTGTKGTRAINTQWPLEEGLELGTSKIDGREFALVPDESLTLESDNKGVW